MEDTTNRQINEDVSNEINTLDLVEEESIDWRGRPSNPTKHGGMRAAFFVLGLQSFEVMAISAVGNNLITYVINEMHFPLSRAANIVTNFIGSIFIFSLLGGYLSDAFLGSFWTILNFGFVELSGFILLSVQANIPELRPPKCDPLVKQNSCEEAKGADAMIFYATLMLIALGSGCLKPNMIAHGANQLSQPHPKQAKRLSSFFNASYFAFSTGQLIALTLLVWVQTSFGMGVGFRVSAVAMAIAITSFISGTVYYRNTPLRPSLFTPIAQVFVAATAKRKLASPSDPRMFHEVDHVSNGVVSSSTLPNTPRFRFLDKACIKIQDSNTKESPWRLCTVTQVEQVKNLISLIPIFASTIVFNTTLAQLQTFSVQQGRAMDTSLTKTFHIPPASLQAMPYIVLIFLVPVYDSLLVPFVRKFTKHPSGVPPITRIAIGLFLSTLSMVAAAFLEKKRRDSAVLEGKILSIFWITPQFLIFGVSEMFTAVGLIESFYKQSAKGMESFLMALTYASYSFGFFLSSVLVSAVNDITSTSDKSKGWLGENDLDEDRLDLFYWLLAAIGLLNSLVYLVWSRWNAKSSKRNNEMSDVVGDENS